MSDRDLLPESRRRSVLTALIACALTFALCASLHHARGAMQSHFGSHQDEPSHVVTGMMAHDYVARLELRDPIAFAQDYYLHYPKVAIGQWPPAFYVLQTLWTLPFGISRVSLILLMSLFGALAATALFLFLRRETGTLCAGLAGLLLLLLPLVQSYGSRVLTEVPLALFCLLAVWQFSRYMRTEKPRDAVGFALLACLAIMTKGSALCLALVPPIALLLGGRWRLFTRGGLWFAALIVATLCGPWYWFALGISATTWGKGSSLTLSYVLETLPAYLAGFGRLGGAAVTVTALVGLVACLSRRESRRRWAAPIALIPSLLAIIVVLPVGQDDRHLILAAPVWIGLCAAGAHWLSARLGLLSRTRVPVVLLAVCALFGLQTFELPSKRNTGFQEAVAELLAERDLDDAVFLIASDAIGEGAFVSEVALQERRPGHIVLRGSKVLSSSSWTGDDYRSFFATTEELAAWLRNVPVGVVAFDHSAIAREWFAHQDLLLALLEGAPEVWKPLGSFDVTRNGRRQDGALRLFLQIGHADLPKVELTIETVLDRELR